MNLLGRLTIKNLKLNKKRTIVTIIGIILSVALITAVTAMFFSARASLIRFETMKKGNYHYAFKNVPKEDLKNFKENRNFEYIYFTKGVGYAYLKESKNTYKPYIFVKAFDEKALKNSVHIIEGRLPNKEDEIVIPTHLKTNGRVNYEVGDTLELEVGKRVSEGEELTQDNPFSEENKEEIVETTKKKYTIVGIMERPANTIEDYSAPGYTFATLLKEENIDGVVDVYTRYTKKALKKDYKVTANVLNVSEEAFYYIHYSDDFDEKEYKKQLENLGEPKYLYDSNSYLIQLESGIFSENSTKSLGVVASIVILIIIFTSVFCIKNSFNISITEKIKQYGMLHTIGATSKQIKKNVYNEAFLLGLLGIPIGVICGLFASFLLILISNMLIADMLSMKLIWQFSWLSIGVAFILGFITLYLSARGSARKASKVSPITAIRNSEGIKLNPKKIKSPRYIKAFFGIGGDISYKNLKRNKKKYRATVISIIVCVSVFIALASFIDLAFRTVKNDFQTTDYNINLGYHADKKSDMVKKAREVVTFDYIKNYSIVSSRQISQENRYVPLSKEYLNVYEGIKEPIENINENNEKELSYSSAYINVYRIGDYAFKEYVKDLGYSYEDVKDKGILINMARAQVEDDKGKLGYKNIPHFDYKKGDTLRWLYEVYNYGETDKSSSKKVDVDITLGGVTTEYPFGINKNDGDSKIIVSDALFDQLFSLLEEDFYENIYIDSSNASKLQDEIEKYMGDTDYNLINTEESVKMMRSFYTLVAIFLYGFIIVIALIGVTNIFNTITTNMSLRKREFATLKSIGMTHIEFNRMIRLESFFYGIKSLLIGIPIGCVLSYLIYKALTNGELDPLKYEIPLFAIVISIGAIFLLISWIMKYSIRKINKQNTIETIRNENI